MSDTEALPRDAAGRMKMLAASNVDVVSDVMCRAKVCDCDLGWCQNLRPVFYLRTLHDPAVGIFGAMMSATFETREALEAWVGGLTDAQLTKLLMWGEEE